MNIEFILCKDYVEIIFLNIKFKFITYEYLVLTKFINKQSK
jgi:hypothetical protein